ncbi:MAG: DUF3231 family protein [Bacillota bacterium]
MVFSSSGTSRTRKDLVDISEAFNLWGVVRAYNIVVESAQIWDNYIQDPEFGYLLQKYIEDVKKDIRTMEEMMERYSIKGSDSHPPYIRTGVNSEVIRDQYIATQFLFCKQEHMEMLLRVSITIFTNDKLRRFFSGLTKKCIDDLDFTIKYLKLKGWTDTPPLYPHIPSATNDKLDCGEAFLLWEHLNYRYDTIRITDYFYALSNDGEFKLLLKNGLNNLLRKEIKFLEKEMEHFGIPAPIRPTMVMPPVSNSKELIDDDFLYRTIYDGLGGAAMIHARGFKQCNTNDRVRTLFKKLLLEEMDTIDDLIKYGKMKGWVDPVPKFSQSR